MDSRSAYSACIAVLAVAASAATSVSAQVNAPASGTALSGTVTDAKGAVLPKATVVVHTADNTVSRKSVSDGAGRFSVLGLAPGQYQVDAAAPGFAVLTKSAALLSDGQPVDLPLSLSLSDISEQVTVEADASDSIAAQLAPMDARLDARSARTEISGHYIQNFTSPVADFSELVQNAPGTFSVNPNGIGLGDSKTYFRGFADGNYDITFDGIPFEDTNSPTHHSWAFFPSQWIGGVDFDRSPGTASTVGPTPFGGSINLLSRPVLTGRNLRGEVSYGSFNTQLYDFSADSGSFGPGHKLSINADVHHLSSDGFQTLNYQNRTAGAVKVQYKFSDTTILTGFSGVLRLTANTPNFKGPLRGQIATNGYNYLLNNNPSSGAYFGYNLYYVPTDFEYVGFKKALGRSWFLDTKPYTYSYNNHQNYPNAQTGVIDGTCDTEVLSTSGATKGTLAYTCGTDKLNSYRKYGQITSLSQVSHAGIFRAGLWYEWAYTNRYQIPQNPRNLTDSKLPNFHEEFWTNSYQPFAEYEWHPTNRVTATAGLKVAHYTLDLKQYADNGRTVGQLGGAVFIPNHGGFTSTLPSADLNVRLKQNWSAYVQLATGSIIPPSSVFDVSGSRVATLPRPSFAKTTQFGTVAKLKRLTIDGDYYRIRFGNAYTAVADPNNQSAASYFSSGDSVTQGFEGEANLYLAGGLSFYLNGTVGTARYVSAALAGPRSVTTGLPTSTPNVNYQKWVANTPANTEAFGLTYQRHGLDLGIFDKRVGPLWQDNGTFNQVAPLDPFQVTNLFLNYSLSSQTRLNGTKLRLSFNNLFDQQAVTSLTPANTKLATFTPNPGDSLGLLPGRSITISATFGLSPHR